MPDPQEVTIVLPGKNTRSDLKGTLEAATRMLRHPEHYSAGHREGIALLVEAFEKAV